MTFTCLTINRAWEYELDEKSKLMNCVIEFFNSCRMSFLTIILHPSKMKTLIQREKNVKNDIQPDEMPVLQCI